MSRHPLPHIQCQPAPSVHCSYTIPAGPHPLGRSPYYGKHPARTEPRLSRPPSPASDDGGSGGIPPGNTASHGEADLKAGEDRATPGGYGGKPPGVAFIGVPTGARNAGRRSDGGPEHRYACYTETPPCASRWDYGLTREALFFLTAAGGPGAPASRPPGRPLPADLRVNCLASLVRARKINNRPEGIDPRWRRRGRKLRDSASRLERCIRCDHGF